MKIKNVVLLSTADWDNPFWTNKQHVAVSLAEEGFRVFYIDSLGLRQPSANSSDFGRILRRLKRAFKAPREVKRNIWVWSPIIIPFQKYSFIRKLNRLILSTWLKWNLKKLNINKNILWTYNPLTLDLLNTDGYEKLVYHCVDEIKAQPGMPVEILETSDSNLTKKSDVVFATAPKLYETRKLLNKNTFYFSNVADFKHFNQAISCNFPAPADIAVIQSPIIGFIGAISGYKVNFDLIKSMAISHPDYNFVLIGKVGEGEPGTDVSLLENMNNIHLLGPKNYDDLPAYLKAIDVAMLPNQINEYTDSMFPMKFFEYLAAGKPVVSVNLKSISEHKNVCYLSHTYEEFSRNLKDAVENDDEIKLNQRLALARECTYEGRMKKMLKVLGS